MVSFHEELTPSRLYGRSRNPEQLENQPTHIADMGCGDATLLRGVYQVICDQTLRGRALDCYPLTLIGVDLNPAALAAASRTLTGLPHLLLEGDISDPLRLAADLYPVMAISRVAWKRGCRRVSATTSLVQFRCNLS